MAIAIASSKPLARPWVYPTSYSWDIWRRSELTSSWWCQTCCWSIATCCSSIVPVVARRGDVSPRGRSVGHLWSRWGWGDASLRLLEPRDEALDEYSSREAQHENTAITLL